MVELYLYQSTGTRKRTEENLFVRISKSQAEVANNERVTNRLRARSIVLLKLNYRPTDARPLCDTHHITSDRVDSRGPLRQPGVSK